MKNLLVLIFLLISSSSIGQTSAVKEPTKGQVNAVLKSYLELKNALVTSDLKKAKEGAQLLISNLSKVEEGKLEGNQKAVFAKSKGKIKSGAEQISKATAIDKQREYFSVVSDELFEILKVVKITEGKIYRDFCPMANDNNGAYWLSEKKEITNPYFGKQMLTCGEVKQTL